MYTLFILLFLRNCISLQKTIKGVSFLKVNSYTCFAWFKVMEICCQRALYLSPFSSSIKEGSSNLIKLYTHRKNQTTVNSPNIPVRIINIAVKIADDPSMSKISLNVAVRRVVRQDKKVPKNDSTVPPLAALKYLTYINLAFDSFIVTANSLVLSNTSKSLF